MLRWMEFSSVTVLTGLAVKSTAVLAAGWLVGWALRRQSAATRHALWMVTFVSLGALLLFSLTVPAFEVGVPARVIDRAPLLVGVVTATVPQSAASAGNHGGEAVGTHVGEEARPRSGRAAIEWRSMLAVLWACGFVASLIPMAAGLVAMLRMRQAAQPVEAPDELTELARRLGLARVPVVLEGANGSMPMTFGILRPAIFMPRNADEWGEEQRRAALLHEMAHVVRGDSATHLFGRLMVSLYWWHPLAWAGWREFVKERERAADDMVLRAGTRASSYAEHLLSIARAMRQRSGVGATAVAMARRSQLEGRLLSILDAQVKRGQPRRLVALGAAVVALALVAPLAAMRAIQAPEQTEARGSMGGMAVRVTGQVDYGLKDLRSPLPADLDAVIQKARAEQSSVSLDLLANKAVALGNSAAAQKLLEAALEIRGETAGEQSESYGIGLVRLGNLLCERGQDARAKERYTQALAILGNGPEQAATLMRLGVAEMAMAARAGQGRSASEAYSDAVGHFEQARTADANYAGKAAMWEAVAAQRQNDLARADELYKQALSMQQSQPSGWLPTARLYAQFLQQTGKADEAKAILDRATETRKTVTPRVMLDEPVAEEILKIGGPVSPPRLESKVEPRYTEEARLAKYQGTVVVKIEIGSDGVLHQLSITSGIGLGLDQKAAEAIVQWKFKPAEKGGLPVATEATVEVNFRLL